MFINGKTFKTNFSSIVLIKLPILYLGYIWLSMFAKLLLKLSYKTFFVAIIYITFVINVLFLIFENITNKSMQTVNFKLDFNCKIKVFRLRLNFFRIIEKAK